MFNMMFFINGRVHLIPLPHTLSFAVALYIFFSCSPPPCYGPTELPLFLLIFRLTTKISSLFEITGSLLFVCLAGFFLFLIP